MVEFGFYIHFKLFRYAFSSAILLKLSKLMYDFLTWKLVFKSFAQLYVYRVHTNTDHLIRTFIQAEHTLAVVKVLL